MEVAFLASGELLTVLDVDEVQGQSAKTVKQSLAAQVGVTRFRQKLFWEGGSEIQDDEVFTSVPVKIQLVVLEFWPPDAERDKNLKSAAKEGDTVALENLLKTPHDPNVVNTYGFTPLHYAASSGHVGPAQLLLEAGAELEARNTGTPIFGLVPLHVAASSGHLEVVRALVEAGADKDPTTSIGATPLFLAAAHGHLDIVRFLVESGADHHVTTRNGSTACASASELGHKEIAGFLAELR